MTEQKLLLSQIDRYTALGRALFPLHPRSKRPLETGWRTRDYPPTILRRYVGRGCNLAWRLGPLDMVIDIDPRRSGAAGSRQKLTIELIDPDEYPLVYSGGADRGQHYYAKIPADVNIRKNVPEIFPGVDFLSEGNYVLIPGCIHDVTHNLYRHDPWSPEIAPPAPPALLELLQYGIADGPYCPTGLMGLDELRTHLEQIPALQYRDYSEWLKIGMAIHAASGGDPEAEELWVAWSTSDPLYADQEPAARAKWASFRDRSSGVTAATLVKAAMSAGGSPHGISAEALFKDAPVEAAEPQSLEAFLEGVMQRQPSRLTEAVAQAHRFGLDNWDEIRRMLRAGYSATFGTIDRIQREQERQRRLGRRKKRQEAMTKAQDDAAIAVADLLLEEKFENGRLLVHATNQEFYRFEETHWRQFLPNLVKQHILDTAQDFRDDDKNDLQFRPSTIFAAAKDVLIARTAKATDVFNFQGSPPAVVNTRNAEVWIGKEGEVDVREHSPESYLLTCLDTEYDPDAECPMMDTALEQILRENKEPAEMIRHIWEFAGYAIQPVKNIPAWWLWWGDGSNGKSMVAKVIMGLLGEGAVLPRPIEAFSDKGRNAHATASLVGKLLVVDDDAETTTNLPESALKKLAQSNPMEANPKNQHAFTFRCCATPLILVNGWPRTKDLSHGMRRKAYILPWRRRFTEDEMDFDLEDKILKTELPGVLNRALAGYQRLRRRGRFAEPIECVEAKGDWLRSANPLIEFVSSHLRKTGNGTFVPLSELYSDYQAWCHIVGGVRRPLTQNRFSVAIQQLDYTVDETNTIRGVERLEN